jgi:RHS repeat-associated protein
MRAAWRSFARIGWGRRSAAQIVGGSTRVWLGSLVGCMSVGLIGLALVPAAGSGASAGQTPSAEAPSEVRELPELRTETSDTYVRSDGTRSTRISRDPINYRDSEGNWQPISMALQPSANGTLQASATKLPVTLPSSLSSPVTVGGEGATVSFALEGAGGSASASGSSASYAEALPNVSAGYEEQASRLKETLSLASAAAPSTYRYHLSTTGGLSAKLISGTVVFADAQGHPRYVMPAPSIADSGASARPNSHDVHYELSEDGSELSVVIDSAWLQSPDRVFPVKLDPTIEFWGDEVDCTIGSGSTYENTSLCGSTLSVGWHTSGSSIGRDLLRFNLATAVPEDAEILSSRLAVYVETAPASSQELELYGLEKTPTNSATWNKYDGTNAWKTPGAGAGETGGDHESSPTSTLTLASTDLHQQENFPITKLVEKWARTPSSNHGLLIKAHTETSLETVFANDASETHHPFIEVIWTPKIGTPSDSTFTSQALGDRQSLSVNVADGNLLLQNHVLELPGIGFDLSLTQSYNNLEFAWRSVGMGAILSTGQDIRMEYDSLDGSWAYSDPSGAWWRFDRDPANDKEGKKAFTIPSGLNAKLTEESTGSLALEYVTARVKYYFDSNKYPSYLQKIEDPNKNIETLKYNAEGISSIEDTHGHSITFTHEKTTGERISSIKDALGRKWEFARNAEGQLETVKDPDLHKSKYTYTADNLTQIEDPDGHLIELSYDSRFRLTKIRHVVNGTATTAGTKDVITTFNYERPAKSSLGCPPETVGDTEVVSPNGSPEGKAGSSASGHQTFYCYNNQDQVTKTIDQRGNPSTASYNSGTGTLATYTNPGDVAEGAGGSTTNTIAYEPSGAIKEITAGVSGSTGLTTKLTYEGSGAYKAVEPSSVQTPYSAAGQEKAKMHQTFYGYDANGNLTTVNQDEKEKGKPEVKLTYNGQGQVETSTDPNGNVTKYEYSKEAGHQKGDLLKIEPPSPVGMPLGATKLTYDSLDRVKTVTDGRGNIATYTYDGEDRVKKVEYSDGSSVSFKFDADGNTTERTDAKGFGEPYTGLTLYEYDKLNRPTLETTPTAKSTRYVYDYDGNLTSLEDAGKAVTYAYGSDDVLTSLTEPENSAHPFKFGYQTETDNRESTTYPNGLLQCTKSDRAGRLTNLLVFKPTGEQNCASAITPSATLEDYELKYTFSEKVGEETITVDTPELQLLKDLKASKETSYEYDTLDRLLKATLSGSPARVSEYKYDNAGNMELNHTYAGATNYINEHMKYNAANEICAIATATPNECAKPSEPGIAGQPTYDEDGNMTSDGLLGGANKFAYTVRDQLSSITPHGESAKAIVSHGTGQADLAAIGSEEVVQNVLGVGVTGSGESAKYYTRGSEGTLFAKRTAKGKPSETEYFMLDPFGSVAMLTSATGGQTAPASGRYEYDAYGASLGTAPTTFGFEAGQTLSGGLVHFGARYYAQALARWTQRDPMGDGYDFVEGDPINQTDPSGSCTQSACTAIAKKEIERIWGAGAVEKLKCYGPFQNGHGLTQWHCYGRADFPNPFFPWIETKVWLDAYGKVTWHEGYE